MYSSFMDRLLIVHGACKLQVLFGFYDPCHLPNNPGWPLRNFLAVICFRWKVKLVRFLCYREKHGLADMGLSLVGEALVSVPEGRDAENG